MTAGRTAFAREGLLLYAALFLGKLVHYRDNDTVNKEASGSFCKERDLYIREERDIYTCERTVSEIRRAVEILKKNNKKVGLACGSSPEELEFWKSLGLDMIFSGGDWSFLYAKATEVLKLL